MCGRAGQERVRWQQASSAAFTQQSAAAKSELQALRCWCVTCSSSTDIPTSLSRQLTLSVCHAASVASPETVTSKVGDARLKELGIQDLGQDKWNRSYYPKLQDTVAVHKPWYLIDAEGQTLGRLAVLAATVLR